MTVQDLDGDWGLLGVRCPGEHAFLPTGGVMRYFSIANGNYVHRDVAFKDGPELHADRRNCYWVQSAGTLAGEDKGDRLTVTAQETAKLTCSDFEDILSFQTPFTLRIEKLAAFDSGLLIYADDPHYQAGCADDQPAELVYGPL